MTLSRIGLIERGLGAKPVSSMQGHAVHAADQQKLACAATAVIRSSDERTCCDDAFDEELEDAGMLEHKRSVQSRDWLDGERRAAAAGRAGGIVPISVFHLHASRTAKVRGLGFLLTVK